MRCAGLLAQLAAEGGSVDRSGAGVVVEVYPAAALKHWGLPFRGYKAAANAAVRGEVVDRLAAATPWLRFDAYEPACRQSDLALDAVVAALNARAAAVGRPPRRPSSRPLRPERRAGSPYPTATWPTSSHDHCR